MLDYCICQPNFRSHLLLILFLSLFLLFGEIHAVLKEIFRDDFNGTALNQSRWNCANLKAEVNSELQYYLPETILITNGSLKIISQHEEHYGASYTSGRVDTKDKFQFKYGEIEWRAKLPKGKGMWPALWLLHPQCLPAVPCPDYWPPAVSVVDYNGGKPQRIRTTAFYRLDGAVQSPGKGNDRGIDMSLDYHIYRLLWTETTLTWFIDNDAVFDVSGGEKVPSTEMQIVMNVAVGGAFPGSPDNTTLFPTEFLIDYVVVRQKDADLSTRTSAPNNRTVAIIVPVISVVILAMIAGMGGYTLCRRRKRNNCKRPSLKRVGTDETLAFDDLSYLAGFLNTNSGYEQADSVFRSYLSLLEIPLANVEIGEILDKGYYGQVRKGAAEGLRGQPLVTKVAVKSVKDTSNSEQRNQLLQEMKVMMKAGRHLNIINILGTIFKGEFHLLLEYAHYGSMLRYLKSHQTCLMYNHTDTDGNILPFDETHAEQLQRQADMEIRNLDDTYDGKIISTRDLINFAFQISRGMAYLNSRSIIHRDLAARNVLVCENRLVKIADFGMARQLEEYVLINKDVALPVRWMPPESIRKRIFSQKSDVWSFGVLLWEVFSWGDTPYTNCDFNLIGVSEFLASLQKGFRLDRPRACPAAIYDLMLRCWHLSPEIRPAFSQLERDLALLIGPDSASDYLSLDVPYQQFNFSQQDLLAEISNLPDESQYLYLSCNIMGNGRRSEADVEMPQSPVVEEQGIVKRQRSNRGQVL